jgi:cell division protein FtsW
LIKIFNKWWNDIDKINFLLIIIIAFIGILLSFSLNDTFSIFNKHLIFSICGIALMIFISFLDLKSIRRLSLLGTIFCIILLVTMLFLDFEINGANRWIKIANFSLQPSEFIKPFFLLLSAWFILQGINGRKIYLTILFLFFLIISFLIILQPDLGMTILFASAFFCQLFIAGLSIFLVITFILILITLSFSSYFIFDHVEKRVNLFFESTDTDQIGLSLSAFRSGGWFGKGPGQGSLKDSIPDSNTDFIFAVAGEELGYLFCTFIVLLILFIVIRFLLKLLRNREPFEIVAIGGLTCSYGLQSLINIFSSLGIIPTKGMTLPLISYGGSSIIASFILFGFLLSLTKKKKYE